MTLIDKIIHKRLVGKCAIMAKDFWPKMREILHKNYKLFDTEKVHSTLQNQYIQQRVLVGCM